MISNGAVGCPKTNARGPAIHVGKPKWLCGTSGDGAPVAYAATSTVAASMNASAAPPASRPASARPSATGRRSGSGAPDSRPASAVLAAAFAADPAASATEPPARVASGRIRPQDSAWVVRSGVAGQFDPGLRLLPCGPGGDPGAPPRYAALQL